MATKAPRVVLGRALELAPGALAVFQLERLYLARLRVLPCTRAQGHMFISWVCMGSPTFLEALPTLWTWLRLCSVGIFRGQVIQSWRLSLTVYRMEWFVDTCYKKSFIPGIDSAGLESYMSSVSSSHGGWEITCADGIFSLSVGLGGADRCRQGWIWEATCWEQARRRPAAERT